MNQNVKNKPTRNYGYDLIKVVSIIFICFYHYNYLEFDIVNNNKITYVFSYAIFSLASCAVPLFFMVHGAILLNKDYDLKSHIYKTIRIVILTVIWGVIGVFVFQWIDKADFNIKQTLLDLWNMKADVINHLWFLQTLVCIYLLFPFIKVVYDSENRKVLYYGLVLIFILTFGNTSISQGVNVLEYVFNYNYLVRDDYNFFHDFNVFRGFYAYSLLYFILGGLIAKAKDIRQNKKKSYAMIIIAIYSYVIHIVYGLLMSKSNQKVYDIVWYGYSSVFVLLMCVVIFIFAKEMKIRSKRIADMLLLVGGNTLGIFLLHRFIGKILGVYIDLGRYKNLVLANILYACIIAAISLLLVLIAKRIPLIKELFHI